MSHDQQSVEGLNAPGSKPVEKFDGGRGRIKTNMVNFEKIEHHDDRELRVFFDSTAESPTVAVACAVAELAGKDPLDVGPVANSVDTSALDAILRSHHTLGTDVRVQFSVDGYDVEVTSYGRITVRATTAIEHRRP